MYAAAIVAAISTWLQAKQHRALATAYAVTAIEFPVSPHVIYMTFAISGGPKTIEAESFLVNTGTTHTVVVTTDPVKHLLSVQMDGVVRISQTFTDGHVHVAPITALSQDQSNDLVVEREPTPRPGLCLSLIH